MNFRALRSWMCDSDFFHPESASQKNTKEEAQSCRQAEPDYTYNKNY